MIRLENLNKAFHFRGQQKVVADNLNLTFPSGVSVGLLGRNGAGKSTLLRMIAGSIEPDSGRIRTSGTISWPVGLAGGFHQDLTGSQNVRFIARVYGVDTEELLYFVESFAELGIHFHQPVRTYSSGMRARLGFGVSMGIPFDTYLVDEVTSVGDENFRVKAQALFKERMRNAGAIVVTHAPPMMRQMCEAGAVLVDGRLHYFDDVGDAIAYHFEVMRQQNLARKSLE
ncbi:ABC transporter ATP-binding protein [Ruegeria aquimaris]|uniref:ABC transporter ATP-binding protein n=1 Tax=Ruegeria aquimaris TaxID=2984333 RepID=A0ABT3AQ95_9RHOB|nr:ABC transporter ATP-binding protein [Ruegeria sp. XHP0148]MCV2890855.1 ABC transporter ATP-binding protein [Ruegeria sp. XHP0148]